MATPVVMPQLGESIVEATLVRWLVAPGTTVERGQVLAEVETDKASSEIPAPTAGILTRHLIEEGETVAVGTQIAEMDGDLGAQPTEPERQAPMPVQDRGGPRRTSPAVRRLARKHDIDITKLTGTGRKGRVTRDDVLAAIDGQPSTPPPVARSQVTPFETALPAPAPASTMPKAYRPAVYRPTEADEVVPFTRRRKWIAEHMVHSLGVSAHVAAVAEIDMSRVMRRREADRADAEARSLKLTMMPYVVQAVAAALAKHRVFNASVVDDSLVKRADVNIGIAVDTADGLIVPVIRRADELHLMGLARAIQDLSERARAGALTPDDVAGGSFTISNPGRDGNLFGVSIIRQPEVGILRIGAIVKRPVVRQIEGEDAIVIRPIMYACLSYDHRVIDGRAGNAFLKEIVDGL